MIPFQFVCVCSESWCGSPTGGFFELSTRIVKPVRSRRQQRGEIIDVRAGQTVLLAQRLLIDPDGRILGPFQEERDPLASPILRHGDFALIPGGALVGINPRQAAGFPGRCSPCPCDFRRSCRAVGSYRRDPASAADPKRRKRPAPARTATGRPTTRSPPRSAAGRQVPAAATTTIAAMVANGLCNAVPFLRNPEEENSECPGFKDCRARRRAITSSSPPCTEAR